MAKQLQLRKGTATEHNTFTGANGEVTVDTTNKTLRVHDGVTAGGTPLLNASQLVDSTSTVKGVARFATDTEVINKSNVSAAVTPSNTATIAQSTDLGVGQTWQGFTGSRSSGVTYTNTTGKPIQVSVVVQDIGGSTNDLYFFVNGTSAVRMPDIAGGWAGFQQLTVTVPSTQTYKLETTNLLYSWAELR